MPGIKISSYTVPTPGTTDINSKLFLPSVGFESDPKNVAQPMHICNTTVRNEFKHPSNPGRWEGETPKVTSRKRNVAQASSCPAALEGDQENGRGLLDVAKSERQLPS